VTSAESRWPDPFDARYGSDAAGAEWPRNPTVELQLQHRSVRRFLPREVSDALLASIIAAAQSASTSSNLQSWSVVAVRDRSRRARLASLARSMPSAVAGPVILVFLADWARARSVAEHHGVPIEYTQQFDATLVAVIDAAIAAQNAALAAESFGLGTVFVGSMRDHPEEVAAELGLPHGVVPVFALVIGWPDPMEEAGVKPRLPQSTVLHSERYRPTQPEELAVYDQRVREYYEGHGIERGWLDRLLARLARIEAPRARLREAFERLGIPSR
jgi:nitroreductase